MAIRPFGLMVFRCPGPVVPWFSGLVAPCLWSHGPACLQEKKVVRFILFAKGGVCAPPQPPGVLQPSMLPIRTSCLHHVCRKVVRIMLFANRGVPCCFTTIRASNKTIMSSPCLQEGEVVRIILFANGGGCPPQPPRCFKTIHARNKKVASCHHHVCSEGKLCR